METISRHLHGIMIIGSAITSVVTWIGMILLLNEPNSTVGSIIIGAYFASLSWLGASVISAVSKLSDEKRHTELLSELYAIRKSFRKSRRGRRVRITRRRRS